MVVVRKSTGDREDTEEKKQWWLQGDVDAALIDNLIIYFLRTLAC